MSRQGIGSSTYSALGEGVLNWTAINWMASRVGLGYVRVEVDRLLKRTICLGLYDVLRHKIAGILPIGQGSTLC